MAPSDPGLMAVRIAAMRYGAVDIVFLDLEPLEAAPLPEVEPGAHVDLHFGDALVRQYSVVTPLSDGGLGRLARRARAAQDDDDLLLHQRFGAARAGHLSRTPSYFR